MYRSWFAAPVIGSAAPFSLGSTNYYTPISAAIPQLVTGAAVHDVDYSALYPLAARLTFFSDATQGVAVVGHTASFGTWQYNTNDGSGWHTIVASPAAALLLQHWPFFQSVIDLIEMVLAKADMRIAAIYDEALVTDPQARPRLAGWLACYPGRQHCG